METGINGNPTTADPSTDAIGHSDHDARNQRQHQYRRRNRSRGRKCFLCTLHLNEWGSSVRLADIACDETLRVTGLTREQLGTEEFDRLSDVTQEQVAVLARLAFAKMLIDRGEPVTVILDDALAYSDSERIERMFDVLT